ncbi:MAG: C39 family peptidase [Nocardioidaceae bacterium]
MKRTVLQVSVALAMVGTGFGPSGAAVQAADDMSPQHVSFQQWDSTSSLAQGRRDGTKVDHGRISLAHPIGTRTYSDPFGDGSSQAYEYATWTSPVVHPGFALDELVASWNARTPDGTWIEVEMRGTTDSGATSKWYVMGRWASDDPADDGAIHRTSVPSQGDEVGYVAIDTFVARTGRSLSDWQLRVTLYQRPSGHGDAAGARHRGGRDSGPTVDLVGAMASALAVPAHVPASPLGGAEGITLDVPAYSQETHIGQYPQWDNGGEAWCSPTSTAMVVAYWGTGPTRHDLAWVDPAYADPQVDHAARNVYDYNYDGAGNWPFNTAYAATFGLESFVTRLRSLTEAEQFIKAGIPLVVSVSFKKGELDGAGYGTNGHLMVIVGFDDHGDVIVNDPASHLVKSNDAVRTTYDREQFENTWIPHSGGIAYVIRPADVPLPSRTGEANW